MMQYLFDRLEACSSLTSSLCVLSFMLFVLEIRSEANLRIASAAYSSLADYVKDRTANGRRWEIVRAKYQETLNASEESESKQAVEFVLRVAEEVQKCGREAGTKKKPKDIVILDDDESEDMSEESVESDEKEGNESSKETEQQSELPEEKHEDQLIQDQQSQDVSLSLKETPQKSNTTLPSDATNHSHLSDSYFDEPEY